ncbi:NAD(P)H-hydrate dehydratase [Novipirellula caenicola]|uniref:ADP-dependent (S)-NAD(P)H-hydrate dehydratase n=1 Tax=Novipirellula caenicola TaxID=1536901 RepID=A0ABP9VMU5_9BACT
MNHQPPVSFPKREHDSHKGSFGRVLLCGGSREMAGSIALSSMAALHTGSGLVSAAVPDRCLETVAAFHPCVMTIPLADASRGHFATAAADELGSRLDGLDAIGCGPGMTTNDGSMQIVRRLIEPMKLARVFDADALNCLAKMEWAKQDPVSPETSPSNGDDARNIVLTPHPGELGRLTGAGAKDRDLQIEAAQKLAAHHRVTIVVKGGPTVVVDATRTWTNSTGNPGMATAGTGDVLTGVITSLLGQGLSPWDAARLGVWIHGSAGDRAAAEYGQPGMSAYELLAELPKVIAAFDS